MTIITEISNLIDRRSAIPAIPQEIKHGHTYLATLTHPSHSAVVQEFRYNPYSYDGSYEVDGVLTSLFNKMNALPNMSSVEYTYCILSHLLDEDTDTEHYTSYDHTQINYDRSYIIINGSGLRYREKGRKSAYPKSLTDDFRFVIVRTGEWIQPEITEKNNQAKKEWLVQVAQFVEEQTTLLNNAGKLIEKALSDK